MGARALGAKGHGPGTATHRQASSTNTEAGHNGRFPHPDCSAPRTRPWFGRKRSLPFTFTTKVPPRAVRRGRPPFGGTLPRQRRRTWLPKSSNVRDCCSCRIAASPLLMRGPR